jgi:aryl-alcohol dehydrogenase-like predicted oxidoreductase
MVEAHRFVFPLPTGPKVPLAESVGALKELQDAGKIRMVGMSNVTVEQLAEARAIVEVVAVQTGYSLADRKADPVLEACARDGIGFIPSRPIDHGKLARPASPLDALATSHGVTAAQLSLAWLLHRSPVMLPIPGTSRARNLEENMGALDIRLTDEECAGLEQGAALAGRRASPSRPPPGLGSSPWVGRRLARAAGSEPRSR